MFLSERLQRPRDVQHNDSGVHLRDGVRTTGVRRVRHRVYRISDLRAAQVVPQRLQRPWDVQHDSGDVRLRNGVRASGVRHVRHWAYGISKLYPNAFLSLEL